MTDLQQKLGRRLHHDPRSRSFVARTAPQLVSATHRRAARPYDQQEGSCTGQMMAGMLMTEGLRVKPWRLYERQAKRLYAYATTVDPFEGTYPPDDTGSSTLGAAKAAKHYGYIESYAHAFGTDQALGALVAGTIGLGTNWYSTMMTTTEAGELTIGPGARLVGGHAYQAFGIDVENERIWCWQSWGRTWGIKGKFWMSFQTIDRLLSEDGECLQVTTPYQGGA